MNNYEEMLIEGDMFQEARLNFNLMLQRLFKAIEKNESDEGSITLKVDMMLSRDYENSEEGMEEVASPLIKHKVAISVPVKDSIDGKTRTGMNIVYDEELGKYVLRHTHEGGQRTLFDSDFEENLKGEGTEGTMLTGPTNELPAPEEVIEGEYQEADEDDEAGNPDEIQESEEIIEQPGKEAPGGDTGVTFGTNDDYDYEEPEEEE